jgi:hypothetical protein
MKEESEVDRSVNGVRQSFCVTVTHYPGLVDADGQPVPPTWDFRPEGQGITPSDCTLMMAKAIEWVVLGQAIAKEKAKDQKIIPVGGGRGRIIRVQ